MSISQSFISALAALRSRADLPAFAARIGLPPLPNIPQSDALIELVAAHAFPRAIAALTYLAEHASPEVRRRSARNLMALSSLNQARPPRKRRALSPSALTAITWLRTFLTITGPWPTCDILAASSRSGISRHALYIAKANLRVIAQCTSDQVWIWSLPGPADADASAGPPPEISMQESTFSAENSAKFQDK